jgi:hypothetical protein
MQAGPYADNSGLRWQRGISRPRAACRSSHNAKAPRVGDLPPIPAAGGRLADLNGRVRHHRHVPSSRSEVTLLAAGKSLAPDAIEAD